MLYNRVTKLIIGSKEYDGRQIDIDFTVEFDNNPEPNIHEISIWNTTEDTKALIKKGVPVILNAGYGHDIGSIVVGTVGDFEVNRYDTDNELKLLVGDGIESWLNATVVKSYVANITSQAVVNDLLGMFGLEVGKLALKSNITYANGISFNTSLNQALKRIASDTKSKFYIKNGVAFMVSEDFNVSTGFLLNADTGLIGTPEKIQIDKKIGWKIRCLLNHRLSTDSLLQVQSRSLNGNVKVVKGKHTSDFISELEVLEI